MNDQAQNTTDEAAPVIQNLDQFAYVVGSWFDRNHAELSQFLQVPDGQPITIQLEEGGEQEDLILTGDMLKGFKAGLIVTMNIFGELPFGRASAPTAAEEAPVSGTVIASESELAQALASKPANDAASSGS